MPGGRSRIAGILAACTLLAGAIGSRAEPPGESPKDVRQLLQEGLFEEEASQDLGKAAAAYSALIAKVDAERALAATAIFRLAEVRQKQGKKDEAEALWRRIPAEFPNQTELVKLSRDRLASLGVSAPGDLPQAASDEEVKELARLRDIAKNSPDLLFARDGSGGKAPLDYAAEKGWLKVADYLLSQGAKPDETGTYFNPLVLAAAAGHKTMVDFLLNHGAQINGVGNTISQMPGESGRMTPLMAALSRERPSLVSRLLERGADVNTPGSNGTTALHIALLRHNFEWCRLLLDKGANPNVAEKEDERPNQPRPLLYNPYNQLPPPRRTALYYASGLAAAGSGRTEFLKLLLERGAKPGVPGAPENTGATEIEDAIQNENTKALELLLAHAPKLKNMDALALALGVFNREVLALVLGHFEDVNVKDKNGLPPLQVAINYRWFEAIPMLLAAGASPNATDKTDRTALHYLAEVRLEPVEPPLSPSKQKQLPGLRTPPGPRAQNTFRGGRTTIPNFENYVFPQIGPATIKPSGDSLITIMNQEWAKRRPLFEAMLERGAKLDLQDQNGCTPLFLLIANNSWGTDAMGWFVSKGADPDVKGALYPGNVKISAIAHAESDVRPELARLFLLPKLAKPDTVLAWRPGNTLDKPMVIHRGNPDEKPPTLLSVAGFETIAAPAAGAEGEPEKSPRMGTQTFPRPNNMSRPQVAVINRKGPDGKWKEHAVVSLAGPSANIKTPDLQWGDAIFLCATDGGYQRDTNAGDLKEDASPR